jgi:hypothetical protein
MHKSPLEKIVRRRNGNNILADMQGNVNHLVNHSGGVHVEMPLQK